MAQSIITWNNEIHPQDSPFIHFRYQQCCLPSTAYFLFTFRQTTAFICTNSQLPTVYDSLDGYLSHRRAVFLISDLTIFVNTHSAIFLRRRLATDTTSGTTPQKPQFDLINILPRCQTAISRLAGKSMAKQMAPPHLSKQPTEPGPDVEVDAETQASLQCLHHHLHQNKLLTCQNLSQAHLPQSHLHDLPSQTRKVSQTYLQHDTPWF